MAEVFKLSLEEVALREFDKEFIVRHSGENLLQVLKMFGRGRR
jgi:hypothetical protein